MNYAPTKNEVFNAANALVEIARTPANAKGFVSSDEVRAYLVRATNKLVEGSAVSYLLSTMFNQRDDNRYAVSD